MRDTSEKLQIERKTKIVSKITAKLNSLRTKYDPDAGNFFLNIDLVRKDESGEGEVLIGFEKINCLTEKNLKQIRKEVAELVHKDFKEKVKVKILECDKEPSNKQDNVEII